MDPDIQKFLDQLKQGGSDILEQLTQSGGDQSGGTISPGGTGDNSSELGGLKKLLDALVKSGGIKALLGGGSGPGASSDGYGSALGGFASSLFGGGR